MGTSTTSSPSDLGKARIALQRQGARSKPGIWGPPPSTQSVDEFDDLSPSKQSLNKNKKVTETSTDTSKTKEESADSSSNSPTPTAAVSLEKSGFERMMESASAALGGITKSATSKRNLSDNRNNLTTTETVADTLSPLSAFQRNTEVLSVFIDDACSPCSNRSTLSADRDYRSPLVSPDDNSLGFGALGAPGGGGSSEKVAAGVANPDAVKATRVRSTGSAMTPASRRRQRHMERQMRSTHVMPLSTLTVKAGELQEIEESISELTMRSSYGEATAKLAENRRMAYYAVGKHHKNSGRGGNRRCYFTGKLILGGTPFYAGSVQQGLRTLVVFCLPSAIGLPKNETNTGNLNREGSINTFNTGAGSLPRTMTRESSYGIVAMPRTLRQEQSIKAGNSTISHSRSGAASILDGSMSRLSSLDDMSLSLEEDLDPNWGLDRDYLLTVLPAPSQDLLDEMSRRFPEQFETLPIQVRSPHCWRLFIKFCFFSGLPIAEGELHYKVREEVANEAYGEEIILSHEVMEAVNGESAEILRLPNQKTFRYLRKHYTQQSGKLSDAVFQRKSWELVLPEI
eukprot:CAMPEP_0194031968 /NCGR_PEP_ID=MMETSP0009_2-20130614/5019_1 /TAXON_ID=210454 /ORGANISM="Grammatophora oceanica, Strain CCMP 410" /LENGTH=570 /DNA_ID=CAMNT_0038672267 /DNA_START=282 /DNA_END=1994 /DNA_ORIENTATION=+